MSKFTVDRVSQDDALHYYLWGTDDVTDFYWRAKVNTSLKNEADFVTFIADATARGIDVVLSCDYDKASDSYFVHIPGWPNFEVPLARFVEWR